MRQRILYHAVMLGLHMLEEQLAAAEQVYAEIEGTGWDDELFHDQIQQHITLEQRFAAERVLHDRYGPFDAVAGQRSPWEKIP